MTEGLRIGIVDPTGADVGGIWTYTAGWARKLLEAGHSPVVITNAEGPITGLDEHIPCVRLCGGESSRLPFPLGRGASMAMARQLAKISKAYELDLLEAPAYGALTGFLSLFKTRKPATVVKLHICSQTLRQIQEPHPARGRRRIRNLLHDAIERRAIETAEAVTAVSNAVQQAVWGSLGIHRDDWVRIPYPIDDRFYSVGNDAPAQRKNVVYVGRLEYRKRPDRVIEAVPQVLAAHPNARFLFIGPDSPTAPGGTSMLEHLRTRLTSEAKTQVEFVGAKSYADMPAVYEQADVCLLPSMDEALPISCMEAMAAAKPLVVSDIPPMKELVDPDETGYIIEKGDPAKMAAAINRLLGDPEHRRAFGEAARRRAREFQVQSVYEAMMKLYFDAITHARR